MLTNGTTLARRGMAQLHKAETARTGRLFMRASDGTGEFIAMAQGGFDGPWSLLYYSFFFNLFSLLLLFV